MGDDKTFDECMDSMERCVKKRYNGTSKYVVAKAMKEAMETNSQPPQPPSQEPPKSFIQTLLNGIGL